MRSSLIALGLVAATAAVAGPSQKLTPEQAAIAALPATGKPQQCVNLRQVMQTKPAGPRAILFQMGSNRWLRNDLRVDCPARGDRILVIRSPAGTLCRGEIVDVVDPISRFQYGSCILGDYTPVNLPKGLKF